jgi:hypothetical protein
MSEPDEASLKQYLEAGAEVLGVPLEAAWTPSIVGHLQVTLRHAALVAELELPDETEPAPVFEA